MTFLWKLFKRPSRLCQLKQFKMKSITRSQSSSEFASFQSPSIILSSDDSDIVKIKKVSSSIKANIGRRRLFRNFPTDEPRLRKSAILKFASLAASTPIIPSKLDLDSGECFISPITPNESDRIIKPVSKRKSRSSLRNAVKAFNAEIKQENKLRSGQKNASAQVSQEINQSKIQEILQVDASTTEKLQTSLFKKPTGSLQAESKSTIHTSKYKTRQTQTSDSLNASHQKFNQNNSTNEEASLSSLKSGVVNSASVVKNSLDQANGVINSLDQEKEGFVNISIISISDISVSQTNDFNQLEENPANESMIFSELPVEQNPADASSVGPEIVTDNNNEPVVSSIEDLLVLSHLNLETELKEIKVIEQKVKEKVTTSGRIAMRFTPLRERLRSRNTSVNQTNRLMTLPRLTTNKRKCREVEGNEAKKQSPEVGPSVSKIQTKELLSEENKITNSKEELVVQKKGNRKKKNNGKRTKVTRTTQKKSENSETDGLPKSLPNKENLHDQHTETLKPQLSQLQEFSPFVVLEKLPTHTSSRVQTRSQTKTKKDSLPPESSADETNERTVCQSLMDIPNKRDNTKKITINMYQYVFHRKSGFYQLPDEPITAARGEGRPQRTRRPPKQFIQAAFIPELPALRRTTKFKPEKIAVKDEVRKGCKKPKAQTHSSRSYNLRSSTIRSENVSNVLPCTPQPKESKKKEVKKKGSSRTRRPLQDVTENVNRINSCMDEVERTAQKLTAKKKVGKRLDYGNELQNTDDTLLPHESVCNVNLLFDQSHICVSDNTITGVRRLSENQKHQEQVTEENSHFQCIINDKFVDVKCYSKMPLFEGNDGHPITVLPIMVNRSQYMESTLGHMKILPNKKLFVEANKYLFTSYTVIQGKGVCTIANRRFPLDQGSVVYVPLGFLYSIHNNSSSPLMLQYTMSSKL